MVSSRVLSPHHHAFFPQPLHKVFPTSDFLGLASHLLASHAKIHGAPPVHSPGNANFSERFLFSFLTRHMPELPLPYLFVRPLAS